MDDPQSVSEQAKRWVKDHKHALLAQFASDAICKPEKEPMSIFLAGSPGAGKTEASIALQEGGLRAVHIDADGIRTFLPQYTGHNADEVQGAAALGVEKLYDYILKAKKSAIIDATFTPYEKAENNIQRSLRAGRDVYILYVYQPPSIAWRFTKVREKKEGRTVPKHVFLRALMDAPKNARTIKDKFGEQVHVFVLKKNYIKGTQQFSEGVREIDRILRNLQKAHDIEKKLR